ncbi:MAG TPA: efflux RND transporter periplasmic adaptor subunit [Steroidobacteraceae bacterium]|nr:efflux RND transporter periplasmic adaptor subunit [Steroidobacteraceae bacterium]
MSTLETAKPKAMIKPIVIMLIAVILVLGAIFAWQRIGASFGKKFMDAAAHAPQTVSTIQAAASDWQPFIQSTGTLRAVRGADLSAQASGVVDEIAFDSGNDVAAGKVLLRLKPNDDYAKLRQLEAAAELAGQTYKRDQEQFAAQAISQANVDTDVSTLKSARAQLAAQQALIDEKIVKAPFAGRLGIRQVDIGQYLTAGTAVVTLQALDPILVDFYVPQRALAQLKIGQPVSASVDTYANQTFSGSIEAINSKVDAGSRNVQVRASLHNPERRLVPGMFADVRVQFGETSALITLPQTVVTYNPFGDTVFVVEKNGVDEKGNPRLTVQQRFVKLGDTRGDQIAVLSGIKAGEVVVSGGQMKLRNGTVVAINNSVLPSNSPNPNPPNE